MKMEKLYERYESIIPDYQNFMQYLRRPLVQSLRVNTLKARHEEVTALLKDMKLRQLSFYEDGYSVLGKYRLGRHIAHNLGLIYVQEVASMIPVVVLDPQGGEVVLDMCAAPGSKTTQIAQMMNNRGLLIANEISRKRIRGLIHNIKRCGLINEAVISISGQKVHRVFDNYFDRILVDAPCSAEGTIRRSKAVLYHWGIKNIKRMSRIQIGLAVSGFRALRPGGTMVYSTCTIAPEENEMVISYLLEKFPEAEILPVKLDNFKTRAGVTRWQGTSFDQRVENCTRILPQDNDTAPFFIARLTKRGVCKPRMDYLGKIETNNRLLTMFSEHFGVDGENLKPFALFKYRNEDFISTPEVFSFREANAIRKGLEFGRVYGQDLKPDNDFVQLFGSNATRNVIEMEEWQVTKFLKGEIVKVDNVLNVEKGFVIIRYHGLPVGVGKYNGNEIRSAIKRERRTL
ncbi:MAG: NOL1/NOP2/sun family putative RNA methylase [candidate division WOR-3 bacterium]|nr:NOL1/NOP2/sun family putative RNA methylase [candidate division WOR-3 bacterium]